ncbi:MAG: hypothetical protein AAFV43_11000 [Planctomycetota bacterium]
MFLYHGTSTQHLDRILAEGLQPRCVTGQASNWEGDIESKPDFVYLSAAYAIYYAVEAADTPHDPVILQVDWDHLKLYPDEDFIAYHRSDGTVESWQAEGALVDPSEHKELWALSLARSGNVCTPAVPRAAILGYRAIPIEGNGGLLLDTGVDAIPAESNYLYRGDYYRRCLAAYFEHDLAELPQAVRRIYEDDQRKLMGDEAFDQMEADLDRFNAEAIAKRVTPSKS